MVDLGRFLPRTCGRCGASMSPMWDIEVAGALVCARCREEEKSPGQRQAEEAVEEGRRQSARQAFAANACWRREYLLSESRIFE